MHSTSPPPPSYVLHRVQFAEAESPLKGGIDRQLAAEAIRCADASPGCLSWLACWSCCSPDPSIRTEAQPPLNPLREWPGIGTVNQISMLSGMARRLVFNPELLMVLNEGLKGIPLIDRDLDRVAAVEQALSALSWCKNQLSTDAAGISAGTVSHLQDQAQALADALQQLDQHAQRTSKTRKPRYQMLNTPLWIPDSTSPLQPLQQGGRRQDPLTPIGRMRAALEEDIEALRQLKARIPV